MLVIFQRHFSPELAYVRESLADSLDESQYLDPVYSMEHLSVQACGQLVH